MLPGLRRTDLQDLAEAKYRDAAVLLGHGGVSNGYCLAGYAVELGLKAVIARQFAAETIPDPKIVRSIYTHSVKELIGLAGLSSALKANQDRNPAFRDSWAVASEWSEDARYAMTSTERARLMIDAVGGEPDGVLPWLRTHW